MVNFAVDLNKVNDSLIPTQKGGEIMIVILKGEEKKVEKWGVIDEILDPNIGDIVYLSGNPDFNGTYQILSISEMDKIVLIQPQYYSKEFVQKFDGNGKMLKLVVELVSKNTPRWSVKRGVWAFVWDFALL